MLLIIDTYKNTELPYFLVLGNKTSWWCSTIKEAFNRLHVSYSDHITYIKDKFPLTNIYEFPDTYSYEEFKANNPHLFI